MPASTRRAAIIQRLLAPAKFDCFTSRPAAAISTVRWPGVGADRSRRQGSRGRLYASTGDRSQRDLLRWAKGQYHSLGRLRHRARLDHHSAARQLSRIFGKYGNAGEAKDQCQYACSEHRCRSQSISYRMRCKPVRTGVISLGREIGNSFRSPTTLHQMRFAVAMPSPNEFGRMHFATSRIGL